MVLWKFLKKQDWRYAIPCSLSLWLSLYTFFIHRGFCKTYTEWLTWSYLTAALFLIIYSLKYIRKFNKSPIDKFKLIFYYAYFIFLFLFFSDDSSINYFYYSFGWFSFHLYFYSFLFFLQKELEETDKKTVLLRYIVIIVQTFLMLGTGVWAITQKVEAEKQKVLAIDAERKAEEAQYNAEKTNLELKKIMYNQAQATSVEDKTTTTFDIIKAKEETSKAKINAEQYKRFYEQALKANKEAIKYKRLYEETLKQKK